MGAAAQPCAAGAWACGAATGRPGQVMQARKGCAPAFVVRGFHSSDDGCHLSVHLAFCKFFHALCSRGVADVTFVTSVRACRS